MDVTDTSKEWRISCVTPTTQYGLLRNKNVPLLPSPPPPYPLSQLPEELSRAFCYSQCRCFSARFCCPFASSSSLNLLHSGRNQMCLFASSGSLLLIGRNQMDLRSPELYPHSQELIVVCCRFPRLEFTLDKSPPPSAGSSAINAAAWQRKTLR